jgi:phenylacetate-CoA ligase
MNRGLGPTAPAGPGQSPGLPAFLDPIETMSRENLSHHQEAALVQMASYAYTRAPLIRETWDAAGVNPAAIKSTADFVSKVPFITKDTVRSYRDRHNDPSGGMTRAGPGEIVSIGTTSGTTGDPTPIPNGRTTPAEVSFARDHWHIGLRPGDYSVFLMFTFRGGHRRRMMQELGIAEICMTMSPAEMPRLCEASRRYRPTTIAILPNPMLHALERHFEQSGEDPVDVFKSYKGALFGGEPLGERLKALTRSWGLELFENTSLGDVCGASECRAHAGMHAYEDLAYIECVDPVTFEQVPDGQPGELVVTTLVDRFTPLVRYRTDDLVVLDRSPCLCGRTHVRFRLLGRVGDQTIVQGRSILPREVLGLVEAHDETRAGLFQIVRSAREMDRLLLRVGYDPQRLHGTERDLHGRLRDNLAACLDVKVDIELVLEGELVKLGPPHKIPRVTRQ